MKSSNFAQYLEVFYEGLNQKVMRNSEDYRKCLFIFSQPQWYVREALPKPKTKGTRMIDFFAFRIIVSNLIGLFFFIKPSASCDSVTYYIDVNAMLFPNNCLSIFHTLQAHLKGFAVFLFIV